METAPIDELKELAALLKGKGLKLAIAESCTGGLLGHKITSLANCSDFFNGGIISYHNSVKTDLLCVPQDIIDRFGAVSKECAELMAKGARKNIRGDDTQVSDIGLSITGIAGPGGATDGKPVGTVFIALSIGDKVTAERLSLKGERNEIREQAAFMAIRLIIKVLGSERL